MTELDQAEINGATELVTSGDYSTADGKRIYTNTGPLCHKCGLPYADHFGNKGNQKYPVSKRCKCEPQVQTPGVVSQPIPERVATSLEMAAFHLGKIAKLFEGLKTAQEKPVEVIEPPMPAMFLAPGMTDPQVPASMPVVDEDKLAANINKKDEVLKKMGGK